MGLTYKHILRLGFTGDKHFSIKYDLQMLNACNNRLSMRAVIQRVHSATVAVNGATCGHIKKGLLVFLGIEEGDTNTDAEWLCGKLIQVRLFNDEAGKFMHSIQDVSGEILLISQFTLFGTMRKGTRPSFNRAASPSLAIPAYESFIKMLELGLGRPVQTGVFGAYMVINAENDGPVTIILDSKNKDF